MRTARTALACLTVAALVLGPSLVFACPFCEAPSLSLTQQVAQSDAAALVKWVSGTKPAARDAAASGDEAATFADEAPAAEGGAARPRPSDRAPAGTVYEVVEVLKSADGQVKKGGRIHLARFTAGEPGDLFLLLGTQGVALEWSTPLEVTESGYQYIAQAPSPDVPQQKRLAYFMKYLEFPDPVVANDAYAEFASTDYKDIKPLADIMPRERLREWVVSPETPVTRLGLYGLLLGLCGREEDARLMEQTITQTTQDFRLGIDGVMGGYLLLTGERGLDRLDETKLSKDSNAPFSETYAAMQALRFMWTYGDGQISKERLRQSMRTLLDRPELADLVIADLARWKDWSVQDRLMKLYGTEGYDIPTIKRAIVRYLLVCSKDVPEEDAPAEHVARAEKNLRVLREKDPDIVRDAERFFFIQ